MTCVDPVALVSDPAGLVERAIGYALGALREVSPAALARPTPCARWDVRGLLGHVNDSLGALCEGMQSGRVGREPADGDEAGSGGDGEAACLVATFRRRAVMLLGACGQTGDPDRIVLIGDLPLPAQLMAGAGAIEITVHGWDIARACGLAWPVPAALALDLLPVSVALAPREDRQDLFAEPVPVPRAAGPGDRLVAFLGRCP
jgi:uncharacterized protein (TIGR03086 family)